MKMQVSWSKAENSALSADMAKDDSLNKTTATNGRRSHTRFTDQLEILIKAFDPKPYPGYATEESLLQKSTPEPGIQICFRIEELGTEERKGQGQGQDHPREMLQCGEETEVC